MKIVRGTGAKIWGIALIVLGAGLLMLRLSHGQGGFYALMPLALVVLGILRLVRASSTPKEQLFRTLDVDAPESARQIAGRPCAHCSVKVSSVFDGVACKTCDATLHKDCVAEHMTKQHAKADDAPYR